MSARLVLVVPCFNEASRLDAEAFVQLTTERRDAHVLFVDDGSADGTPAILAGLAARSGGAISVLTLPRNIGKTLAIHRGLLAALDQQPEIVGYWDADLATPLSALGELVAVLDANAGVEIVMGARVKMLGRRISRSALRHYVGRVFATTASVALGIGVYDTQCGAKLFRANDVMRRTLARPFATRWLVDVEILARYVRAIGPAAAERSIVEVPLHTWTDVPGSKMTVWRGVQAIWDLLGVARQRTK
jgi:dolichyl-phosphate beta-glucosyltransferase